MRRKGTIARLLAILAAVTLAGEAPAQAGTAVTRGELAVQMARASGIKLPGRQPERAAARILLTKGIDLGGGLREVVTEATLVEIGRSLGARLTTTHPEAPVTPSTGRAFVQAMRSSLVSALAPGDPPAPQVPHVSCQGRASREGRKGTPASQASLNATADPCEEPVP
jgi:hypothetical protein